jgi:hypothetical protein
MIEEKQLADEEISRCLFTGGLKKKCFLCARRLFMMRDTGRNTRLEKDI